MRASPALFTLVLAAACGEGKPSIEAFTEPWIESAATSYQAAFFAAQTCGTIALADDKVDLVRTATATLRFSRSALGVLDEIQSDAPGALSVRALDGDGTPLAQRCLDIVRGLSEARFAVLPLAPEGAQFLVAEGEAIKVGDRFLDLVASVTDRDGKPVRGVPIGRGKDLPIRLTDENGRAIVRTPTTSATRETSLAVEAYGIPGPSVLRVGLELETAECPEVAGTYPLSGEPASGSIELVPAGEFLLLFRPRAQVDGGGYAVDLLKATAGRIGLERVRTATLAGAPPVALDPDDRRRVAVSIESGATVLEVDELGVRTTTTVAYAERPSALAFSNGALFAIVDGKVLGQNGQALEGFADARALLFDGERTIVSEGNRVIGFGAAPIDGVGGALGLSSLDQRSSGAAALTIADEARGKLTVVAPSGLARTKEVDRVSAAIAFELGGDELPDLVVRAPSGLFVFTGDGRSGLVRTSTCPSPDPSGLATFDADGDGDEELLLAEPGDWRVTILKR